MVRSVEGEWAVLGAVVYAGPGRTKDRMGVGGKEEEEKEEQRAFAAELLKSLEKGKHEPRAELGASPGGSSTYTRPL